MQRFALVVAGGKGLRMQSELPKQFMLLLDAPVLMHTIGRFASAYEDVRIVLVLPQSHIEFWNKLCKQLDFDIDHEVVSGGATRFESVKNGLERCSGEGIVGIHDGVRPLVSEALIQRCYEGAEKNGSALPVIQITQSLRRQNNGHSNPVDRNGMVSVQTPQCFNLSAIKHAYEQPYSELFTDDATVFEADGQTVSLVEGEETNLKITTQADLKIAEAILGMSQDG